MSKVHVVGGGLAGVEAAWQVLSQGVPVTLYEMRPHKQTPAHKTGDLAELVCSNSFKSQSEGSAPGLLKREMAYFNSLVVQCAKEAAVPAGQALAVDRLKFSASIRKQLESYENFSLVHKEVASIPEDLEGYEAEDLVIVASGPLTSDDLSNFVSKAIGRNDNLYFYDAIAPVVSGDTLDETKIFRASRWDEDADGDYLNIPLTKEQYEEFIDDVLAAEKAPLHNFEEPNYFESCLPIEVMAGRGRDTLRFGPMKPSGLTDPKTGRWPYANIQLRMEDNQGAMYSLVGFQTKMKWPEQKRIFSKLPGLENVEFYKLGSVHRNTYINGPEALDQNLRLKNRPDILMAGQITGVEGYTESAAIGLLAGRSAASILTERNLRMPPFNTMMGSLLHHVTVGTRGDYQPMNANLGLLPRIPKQRGVSKAERKKIQCERAWNSLEQHM
ncbi:MAG: methylenetetrahydrofolate--tRNA-(uracil(54)-C(5))-methyltransferase (FADH(2)-oxidizing) TrmFO [Pseudobacteriovorax sp.]|nr:methylenetetrahydrofolate--tRNA-(uracil(54)-C(5))-methyltransferase (FADH(2)-oxidizing) TrmFO [Pseudobacteriovorax sp.]